MTSTWVSISDRAPSNIGRYKVRFKDGTEQDVLFTYDTKGKRVWKIDNAQDIIEWLELKK